MRISVFHALVVCGLGFATVVVLTLLAAQAEFLRPADLWDASALHLGHRRLIRLRLDGLDDRYLECSAAPVPSEGCPWIEGTVVQVHIRPSSVRVFCEPAEDASLQKGKPHG